MRKVLFILILLHSTTTEAVSQQDTIDLLAIPFEQLMQMKIKTATGRDERLTEAPATIVVVTAEDIAKRGYLSLDEVLVDLPGFDVMITNGLNYLTAYQRGYRTDHTQRTLLMIDGKIDNNLWSHVADISRQYPVTNIERIEVLFGPVSAVYGPNAFLGIINIITKDPEKLSEEQTQTQTNLFGGSYNTYGFDVTHMGRKKELAYSFTARVFKSDEADLSNQWKFNDHTLYADKNIWGPILKLENAGKLFGEYFDPTQDLSFFGKVKLKDLRLDASLWKRSEGFGPYYAADRIQNNAQWDYTTLQLYMEHEKDITENLHLQTLALFRKNFVGGNSTEAEPDWNDPTYSYVSSTQWASYSKSWLLREDVTVNVNPNIRIILGAKYNLKELTKSYNVPGYWHAYSSAGPDTTQYGYAIQHSTDSVYLLPPAPLRYMPYDNLVYTNDLGGYAEGVFKTSIFKFTAGIRIDHNSLYGSSVNPRLSWITTINKNVIAKLVYGEAFQEPAPMMLWGGWSGRTARTDLKPEKARNLEFISMYSSKHTWLELSAFYSHFKNVKQGDAPESERTIFGGETRFRFTFDNFISHSKDITAYCYYSYLHTKSSITYHHDVGQWVKDESTVGDIAPHKVHAGINVPIARVNLNLRAHYISPRTLYSRNALAPRGVKTDDYFLTNATLSYERNLWTIGIKVNNLFNADYLLPGGELANAGDDTSARSTGYMNSLIPTPDRNFLVYLSIHL